jgi:ectoine hydroxylase
MVRQALQPDEVSRMLHCSEQLDGRFRDAMGAEETDRLNLLDAFGAAASVGLGEPALDLLDCHRTFPKVWGLLGYNISLYHTQLSVNYPGNKEAQMGRESGVNCWIRDYI